MKRFSVITVILGAAFAFVAMAVFVHGAQPPGEVLEYEVISVEPQSWVVTARETATGNVVKFRLPPAVFKGQTFDANLGSVKRGQRFSVQGPRNARLSQLIVEEGLPGGPPRGRRKFGKRIPKISGPPSKPLAWEIVHVDPRKWVVTAKNRRTHKVVKFQAHPEAFAGFRFRANLRGIRKGQGFSIVTPNNRPMNNCATLLEFKK
ncbi:MAG: hypothetical protein GTO45_33695 [Candidatus Aminicenantes bacterium]|nr:hypothetical protein [Candidatus Aminicenantes bacterium]NIM83664.1 hypothetical protein [Candidatus Aminicenantes bacterium]NIN23088.1 hypothetical protein [Candidatus Aminicenantes bacterium]NIN46815.1 hypothetical protein [Candidatus Aminicenantes bacterium]NIN89737.1 hypothetical protein [Candidatus Aminicenantes bacterium]